MHCVNFTLKIFIKSFICLLITLPSILVPSQTKAQAATLTQDNTIYLPIIANGGASDSDSVIAAGVRPRSHHRRKQDSQPASHQFMLITPIQNDVSHDALRCPPSPSNQSTERITTITLNSINIEITLYNLKEHSAVEEVREVLAPASTSGCNNAGQVEPNRVYSTQFGGNPWTGGGSPWTGGGSPWTGGGSNLAIMDVEQPYKVKASSPIYQNLNGFTTDQTGLHNQTGKGVDIFILDTSPFNSNGTYKIQGSQSPPLDLELFEISDNAVLDPTGLDPFKINGAAEISLPWSVSVNHDTMSNSHQKIGGEECDDSTGKTADFTAKMKQHGMYVASLAHAMAPESNVTLVRVLNHCGITDAITVMQALDKIIVEHDGSPAVINMSFGSAEVPTDTISTSGIDQTMEQLFQAAKAKGIALVAAAGNSSASNTGGVLAQEYPASSPHVLGITSAYKINGQSGRSCYANQGDIAAYGGTPVNNLRNEAEVAGDDCDSGRIDQCSMFNAHCIIGQKDDGNYSYLMGTSFASPQIAAIVSLALDYQTDMDIDDLYMRVKCGAEQASRVELGAGIVRKQLGAYNHDGCLSNGIGGDKLVDPDKTILGLMDGSLISVENQP